MSRKSEEYAISPFHKFHELFQPKQGRFPDLSSSKISEMLKSNSLDNAPTRSLLGVINGILNESIEKKNGEIPDRAACLLRKVVQEIERRILKQQDHLRNQSIMYRAREEKYESRIRLIETLATATNKEVQDSGTSTSQSNHSSLGGSGTIDHHLTLSLNKYKKIDVGEGKRREQQESRMTKDKEDCEIMIAKLRKELEMKNKSHEEYCFYMDTKMKETKVEFEEKIKELEDKNIGSEIKKSEEEYCPHLETIMNEEIKVGLEEKIKELEKKIEEASFIRNELEIKNRSHAERCQQLENTLKKSKDQFEEKIKELNEKKESNKIKSDHKIIEEASFLQKELEVKNKSYEKHCLHLETMVKQTKDDLEEKIMELDKKKEEASILQKELEAKNKSDEKQCLHLETMVKQTKDDLEEKIMELDKKKEEASFLQKELEAKNKSAQKHCLHLETMVKQTKDELEEKVIELDKKKEEVNFLAEDLEKQNKFNADHCLHLETMLKEAKSELTEKTSEFDNKSKEANLLMKELEIKNKSQEERCFHQEILLKETKVELEGKIEELRKKTIEVNSLLEDLNKKNEERKLSDTVYRNFICCQLQSMQDLRLESDSIKKVVLNAQKGWNEEYTRLGKNINDIIDTAEICHSVLEENRKIYNELQELKGNIRVYCRIRPFSSSKAGKPTIVDYIGENGELIVTNPSKPGKESHRTFKFNKVFGPASSQEEVYLDTQPLIRSILDGFNVCIFAYGQTGSGKTYTMSGPNGSSKENLGVNYRALNDLFHISQTRKNTITYEVDVQMVEIYNEQVRDLLTNNDGPQKKLDIRNASQQNGLVVPNANVRSVSSTADVVELMTHGMMNRAASATAMNERSSRSHSVLSVRVRGTDLKTNASLNGCLHLVDLAGSERVNRSEVTGDRLKEAQHINKSLAALGDVISALSQKSSHIPYRNSKLTQLLQTSLGGRAKTLMFVQMNPDVESFSETLSTLKFAERASSVELGSARSNKEGKEVKELMEQVSSLKETVAKKEEDIEQLRLLQDLKK